MCPRRQKASSQKRGHRAEACISQSWVCSLTEELGGLFPDNNVTETAGASPLFYCIQVGYANDSKEAVAALGYDSIASFSRTVMIKLTSFLPSFLLFSFFQSEFLGDNRLALTRIIAE